MASEARFIHPCDHTVSDSKLFYDNIDVIRNTDTTTPDSLSPDTEIVRLDSVFDTSREYYENFDYARNVSKNKINWYPNKGPKLGDAYKVKGLFSKKTVESYESERCPRCNGNGWYVSLVGESADVESVSGIEKLMQGFIKALNTKRGDNADGQGTDFDSILGKPIYDEAYFCNEIVSEIDFCKRAFMESQKQALDEGSSLEDSEILEDVVVFEVKFLPKKTSVYISIAIVNKEGDYAKFNFTI